MARDAATDDGPSRLFIYPYDRRIIFNLIESKAGEDRRDAFFACFGGLPMCTWHSLVVLSIPNFFFRVLVVLLGEYVVTV
jgi:hypothetical protein